MKMRNIKRVSAMVLASLNIGSIFVQNLYASSNSSKAVVRSSNNSKKCEQTRKFDFVDLPQIATLLGIGGVLCVGMDEIVIRSIVRKFSKKTKLKETKLAETPKNMSVFKYEKNIITDTFKYLKDCSISKTVTDYLEAFEDFGLKLCDQNFSYGEASKLDFDELLEKNIGLEKVLKALFDLMCKFLYNIEGGYNGLVLKIKELYNECDISEDLPVSINVINNFVEVFQRVTADKPGGLLGVNIGLRVILDVRKKYTGESVDIDHDLVKVITNIRENYRDVYNRYRLILKMETEIDRICKILSPVITGENKGNLDDDANDFFAERSKKYSECKTFGMAYLYTYTTYNEESFKKLVLESQYKNVKTCILEMFRICGGCLNNNYKPAEDNIKNYLEQKLKELGLKGE